jgi:hypothetical protein
MRAALLVGPARSGTTLACRLLNRRPGVLALDEPYRRATVADLPARSLPDFVAAEAARQQRLISTSGRCQTTAVDGHLGNHYNRGRGRSRVADFATVDVDDLRTDLALDAEPVLVIKHTLLFSANIDRLRGRFPVIGMVRNPLAVLLSWNSIDASYRRGQVPSYLETHARAIVDALVTIDDPYDRQVELLAWQFEQINRLSPDRVARYEDVVATAGTCLDVPFTAAGIDVGACRPSPEVVDGNRSSRATPDLIRSLAERLTARPVPYAPFYQPDAIEALAVELLTNNQNRATEQPHRTDQVSQGGTTP